MNLKNLKWHYFHIRKRRPIYVYLLFEGQQHLKKKVLGFNFPVKYFGHIDHKVIMSKGDFENNEKRMVNKLKENSKFFLKLLKKSYVDYEKCLNLWKEIYNIKDYKRFSNKKLADIFQEYTDFLVEYGVHLMYPLYVERYITNSIRKKLEEYVKKDEVDRYYGIIMDPVKEGEILREKISLLKIALKFKIKKNIKEDLKKHIEEFSWMPNNLYTENYYTKDYYLKKIKKLAKKDVGKLIKEFNNEKTKKKKKYRNILYKFKNDKKFIDMIKTAQKSIFFRSFRTERVYKSAFYISNLLKEMAKRLGIKDYKDIIYLTPPEIVNLLKQNKKSDENIISERKKGFCMVTGIENFNCVSGKKLNELRKQIIVEEAKKKELIGSKAYKGKIKGVVCVVGHLNDLKKLKKKDILVTHSTTPDYVPYLHKVSAIVTDEGGITCHAAVISREMKIPCIIGTKNASKVLKDGDYVEVDANKGIVRKMK